MDVSFWKKDKPTIRAVNRQVKPINDEIEKQPIDRIKESLQDFANAVLDAENPLLPESLKYINLLNLYKNIELDEHISSLVDSLTFELIQTPFDIIDITGEKDVEKKKIFERSWFSNFVRYWVKSKLYPFGAIQFTGIANNSYTGVEWVDEYHVRPTAGGIAKYDFSEDVFIDFTSQPWRNWVYFSESDKHLGLYSVIAKLFIMKRDVRQFWAVYNELFTTPYYIVKTDFNNSTHRKSLLDFLTNRKHSGFGVIDHEDEISQLLTYTGTGYASYKDFEDSMNKGMSKAILGQTMTNEDGSSRSQSEVHERTKNIFINNYLTQLEYCINERIIPMMQSVGLPIDTNYQLRYNREHSMTPIEWADVISKLQGYKVDSDDLFEKIGIKAESIDSAPAFAEGKVKAIYEKIKASYGNI